MLDRSSVSTARAGSVSAAERSLSAWKPRVMVALESLPNGSLFASYYIEPPSACAIHEYGEPLLTFMETKAASKYDWLKISSINEWTGGSRVHFGGL